MWLIRGAIYLSSVLALFTGPSTICCAGQVVYTWSGAIHKRTDALDDPWQIGVAGKTFVAKLSVALDESDEIPADIEYARYPLSRSHMSIDGESVVVKTWEHSSQRSTILFSDDFFSGTLYLEYKGYLEEFFFIQSMTSGSLVMTEASMPPPIFNPVHFPTRLNFPIPNAIYYLGGDPGLLTATRVPEPEILIWGVFVCLYSRYVRWPGNGL